MKKIHLLLISMFFMLALLASQCDDEVIKNQTATFVDYSGLDGCRFIIELDNEEKLQPMNLDEFDVVAEDGKKIKISYIIDKEAMSICMVGTAVQIVKIKELTE